MASPNLIYRTGATAVIPGLLAAVGQVEKPKINRRFMPFKAAYFWLWSGSACILPFFPVYMTYVGLSTIQTGLIQGLVPFIGSVAAPIWGSVADKTGKHKTIMLACMVVYALIYGSIALVPLLNLEGTTNWTNVSDTGNAQNSNFIPMVSLEMSNDCANCFHTDISSKLERNLSMELMHCLQLMSSSVCRNNTGLKEKEVHFDTNEECGPCQMCKRILVDFTEKVRDQNDECHEVLDAFLQKCPLDQRSLIDDHNVHGRSQPSLNVLYRNDLMNLNSQSFDRNTTAVFATMMALVFTGRFIKSPIVPILDSTCMVLVKEFKEVGIHADYGRQRMWGAISWGTVSPLTGLIIDVFSANFHTFNDYLPGFCLFVLVYFFAIICVTQITVPKHDPPVESVTRNIRAIISKSNILVFFLAIGVTGISVGLLTTYLFLFIAELSGSHTLMGLTLTLTCVSEVPFMYFASKLIEKLGHSGVITLTLFCYALRFGGYSLLQNPWFVLPIELLHGVTFGALWPTITSYSNLAAPEGMATTMQTLACSVKTGIGMGVGTIGGGVIYHVYGARNLFRSASVMCLVTLIFYWPASVYLDRREERRTRQIQYEEIA